MVKESFCFDTFNSRHEVLQGEWKNIKHKNPNYWNLSCPLEWSKYSCIHQNQTEKAVESSNIIFESSKCVFDYKHHIENIKNKRFIFSGDSLLRQIFISISCLLGSHILKYDVTWPNCSLKKWPCHGTLNCIECGKHSGFENAVFQYNSNSFIFNRMQFQLC